VDPKPDPDPYVLGLPHPDPSIIKQKIRKNLDFYFFLTADPNPDPYQNVTDPQHCYKG
jgi:hypothetical protein